LVIDVLPSRLLQIQPVFSIPEPAIISTKISAVPMSRWSRCTPFSGTETCNYYYNQLLRDWCAGVGNCPPRVRARDSIACWRGGLGGEAAHAAEVPCLAAGITGRAHVCALGGPHGGLCGRGAFPFSRSRMNHSLVHTPLFGLHFSPHLLDSTGQRCVFVSRNQMCHGCTTKRPSYTMEAHSIQACVGMWVLKR
jgi:hypothetical protein